MNSSRTSLMKPMSKIDEVLGKDFKYYCKWSQDFINDDNCKTCITRCIHAEGKILDFRINNSKK